MGSKKKRYRVTCFVNDPTEDKHKIKIVNYEKFWILRNKIV